MLSMENRPGRVKLLPLEETVKRLAACGVRPAQGASAPV